MKRNRTVPGLSEFKDCEFFYIEFAPEENLHSLVKNMWAATPSVPAPSGGGIGEEGARLALKGCSPLLAVSYRGDLAGWRRKLIAFCESAGRIGGFVENQKIILNNGNIIDLLAADISFE